MIASPLWLVPWHADFLAALLDRALEDGNGSLDKAVFVFPHARPMRYMTLLIRNRTDIAKPLVMPRMLTVSGLFSSLAARQSGGPARLAGQLDRVALLLHCVREEMRQGRFAPQTFFTPDAVGPDAFEPDAFEPGAVEPSTAFALDAPTFFPWGLKLDALFEECFSHCRTPDNFLYVDDAVSPYAAVLLSRLGSLFARYNAALLQRGWSSPGFDAHQAAAYLDSGADLPPDIPGSAASGQRLYIAGFHMLNGSEDRLFKRLWQAGASVLLHADPALAVQGAPFAMQPHWSCSAFNEWATRWKTHITLVPGYDAHCAQSLRPRFVAGYDLHSQLAALKEEFSLAPANATLPDQPDTTHSAHRADTAVILPSGELLLPALHHLPDKNLNISMGYPLARSPLFRLLDTIGSLQEGRKGQAYYWRSLIDLFRHPYIKLLMPEVPDAPATPDAEKNDYSAHSTNAQAFSSPALRRVLHKLEQAIRSQSLRYADPRSLLAPLALDADAAQHDAAAAFLDRLFSACLDAFAQARGTRDLALALEHFCSLLLTHGHLLWERFPIDAECLYRLRQSIIPELAAVDFGDEPFPPARLFAMLRALLQAQRVPFEAEPLVGLQVLGLLESRLLSFRRIIVLDATEERLPGSPAGDPLLPEALRPELGLPPLASREQAVAYGFFRLLHSADESLLLWSDSADAPGIQEAKSGRSRFVQELLWQEEKSRGRLFARQGRDGPLHMLAASITPMRGEPRPVQVTGPVRDLLDDLAKRPLSASALDAYLSCPVRFFYERLLALNPAEEVTEGDDPLAVGDLLHQTLESVYACRLQRPLPGGEELRQLVGDDIHAAFFGASDFAALERSLPADSLAMLREAGKKRLDDYLLKQPPTTVLATEHPLNARLSLDGFEVRLTGKADRIDSRPLLHDASAQGLVIVDYKSGRLPESRSAFWSDASFWDMAEALRTPATSNAGQNPLATLDAVAKGVASVQLPLYMLMCSLAPEQNGLPNTPVANALFVHLGGGGDEKALLSSKLDEDLCEEIINSRIPALITGIIHHMFYSDVFFPRPGSHCDWCSSKKSCMLAAGP